MSLSQGLAAGAIVAVGSVGFSALMGALENRRLRREQKARALEQLEQALISSHLAEFPAARHPRRGSPPRLPAAERRQIRKQYLECRPARKWWQLADRWRDWRKARACTNAEIARRNEVLRDSHDRDFERVVDAWTALADGDTECVIEALNEAFSDNEAPAVPLDSDGETASVVVVFDSEDALPSETFKREGRKWKLVRRSPSSRAELYRRSLASNLMAVAREGFAVAPTLHRVDLLAAARRKRRMRKDKLEPIALLSLLREDFNGRMWRRADPLAFVLAHDPELSVVEGQLIPISLDEEPSAERALKEVETLLAEISEASRAPALESE